MVLVGKKQKLKASKVKSIEDLVKEADVIMYLLPDENISDTYYQTEPNIKNGSMIAFAHGFNIHYGQFNQEQILMW